MSAESNKNRSRETGRREPSEPRVTRRSFLRGSLGAVGGMAAIAGALSPRKDLEKDDFTFEKFLQKHYKEMSPKEMDDALAMIRKEVEKRYDVRPEIPDAIFVPDASVPSQRTLYWPMPWLDRSTSSRTSRPETS